jgi:hypothetical protein
MARQKPSDQIATLERQQKELEAKLREARTKANAEAKEAQRRKCELAGRVVLKAIELTPTGHVADVVSGLLDAGVKSAADRALFDLPPHKKPDGEAETVGEKPPLPLSGGAAAVAEMAENAKLEEGGSIAGNG